MFYRKFGKRLFDIVIALMLLIVFAPIIGLICIIQISTGQFHIFYLQKRNSINGEIFRIIKFKTMKDHRDSNGNLLPDNLRITSFGKVLRNLSLDEIPNLLNVILGHMSLVGPRPLPVNFYTKMNSIQKKRYNVRPGITGLAQVNGRNNISWSRKFAYDTEYANSVNFTLDIMIIFKTALIFFRSSVNTELDKKGIDNYSPDFK